MPPSLCAIANTLAHTDTRAQLLQRGSLSLHPIYGTVSTLYLLITYTSAIGGKYAEVLMRLRTLFLQESTRGAAAAAAYFPFGFFSFHLDTLSLTTGAGTCVCQAIHF